ncbi:MAG TPA: Ig-like domain-containing protein, partial [Candidatus Sulfotelmatobacter sp.]|nr:Ig-like domain-containing protein [Candidatus Sulfotelmatobacter sp.]
LIGRESGLANNPVVIRNFVYDNKPNGSSDVNLGYAGGMYNPTIRSNYFQTGVSFNSSGSQTIAANSFLGGVSGISQSSYPNNTYSTARPTANLIEVRANKYEAGRAHIVVYNWQNLSTVSVDISKVLPVGKSFEVRSAWNYYGTPVLSGTYQGGTISLPMTGLTAAKPSGTTAPATSAPAFNTFVLIPTDSTSTSPEAPTLSAIPNQTTSENTPTAPIAFTVSDADTAAANLTVSATSANATLVPNANIVVGGSGNSRSLTLTPAANQSGTATITVRVSDGAQSTSTSFTLTVTAANTAPTISVIPNTSILAGTSTGPLPFTVNDKETAAANLSLLASSSNPTLLPNANIVFGGSDSSRTVTLTPVAGQTGSATVTISVNDGKTTVLRTFVLTVTSSTPPQFVTLPFEAEAGSLVAPMSVLSNPQASGSAYIASATANQGSVTFTVNITVPGTYYAWCNVLAPAYSSDSFFVSVDSGAEDIFDAAEGTWANAWQWSRLNGRAGSMPLTLNPRTFELTTGTHTITFRTREANTGLDKIILSNDPSFVPTSTPEPPANQTIEAATGTVVAPMTVVTDTQAPTRRYVSSTTANQGTVALTVNIPVAGTYAVWCRILGASYASDSFFVSVDGGAEDVYDAAEGNWGNDWQWSKLNGRAGG